MKDVHKKIYELLKEKEKGYLLDAACGMGELGVALEEIGFKVHFADKYDYLANGEKPVRVDLNHLLPFRENTFDFIICSESLQYIENHRQLFSEFHRILKKDGMLIISLPNVLSVSSRLFFLRRGYFQHFKPYKAGDSYKRWNFFYYNPISFVEIFQLVEKIGFELRTVAASGKKLKGFWLYPILKILYLLGLIFERDKKRKALIKRLASRELLIGDHIVVCGVKII